MLKDMSHFFPTKALLWKTLPGTGTALSSLGKADLRYSVLQLDWTQQIVKAVQAKDPDESAKLPQHPWQILSRRAMLPGRYS